MCIVSFSIYDKDQDKLISVKDLEEILTAILKENGLVISSSEIDQIIEATFKEADSAKPGYINFEE